MCTFTWILESFVIWNAWNYFYYCFNLYLNEHFIYRWCRNIRKLSIVLSQYKSIGDVVTCVQENSKTQWLFTIIHFLYKPVCKGHIDWGFLSLVNISCQLRKTEYYEAISIPFFLGNLICFLIMFRNTKRKTKWQNCANRIL